MGNREVTLMDLFNILIKRIWIILAAMVIGGLIALYYSKKVIVPKYESTTKYFIDTSVVDGTSGTFSIDANRNLTVSRMFVPTYIVILNTKDFVEEIIPKLENAGLSREYKADELYRSIKYSMAEDSESFTVTVSAYSPHDALTIAQCIEENAEAYLVEMRSGSENTLKIADKARLNESPKNVKTSVNILIGAFAAAIAVFAIFFIIEIIDVRIKDEKEFEEIIGLPVLGIIPEYSEHSKSRYGYYSSRYSSKSYERH